MPAQDFILDQLEPTTEVPAVDDLLAVVSAARAEADAIRDQARAEGFAQGRAEGEVMARAEAEALVRPAVVALAAGADALAAVRAAVAERVEHQAVELAFDLAGKVVAGAIEAQPERVLDVVRGALRCLVERERLQVLVNPEDLPIVRGAMDGLRGELGGIEHVEVQEERRLTRGGAIVRTPDAEVDAGLRTKLDRAREAVIAELRDSA